MLRHLRDRKHKNNKFFYYLNAYASLVLPAFGFRRRIDRLKQRFPVPDAEMQRRLDYYCKLQTPAKLTTSVSVNEFMAEKKTVYFFDLFHHLRYFPRTTRFRYVFGDVTEVPEEPAIVKSRPIGGDNANSVLMRLEQIRHFFFVKDDLAFRDKKPMLVWRGRLHLQVPKEKRLPFLQRFHDRPGFDVGHVNKGDTYPALRRPMMSVAEQLQYKYILSLEGVDVATNLKWIMSSNSLCFSEKLRFETWFMEGQLIPGVHYVEVADDFSDVEEKIAYYERHPEAAETIIANANAYIRQFLDRDREDLLGHWVMMRYLDRCTPI